MRTYVVTMRVIAFLTVAALAYLVIMTDRGNAPLENRGEGYEFVEVGR